MWELDYKESWAQKNWCFWTVVLEKTPEGPLECKEIQPVHPKGDQSWVFIERTDVEAETPVLWPPDAKTWLTGKDPDAGKDWGQEGKGTKEDEMVGWHHRLDGHGFGWTPGVGDGQGRLACCGHGVAKSQTRLSNWTELTHRLCYIRYVRLMSRCSHLQNLVLIFSCCHSLKHVCSWRAFIHVSQFKKPFFFKAPFLPAFIREALWGPKGKTSLSETSATLAPWPWTYRTIILFSLSTRWLKGKLSDP